MLAFIVKRLVMLVVTLLVASFAVYGSLYLAPGSPIATLTGGRAPSPEVVAQLNAKYHLDDPFLVRYWHWLVAALHGNLGESIPLHENVSTLIASRVWTTAELVLYASILILVIGIAIGLISGLRPGLLDTSSLVVTSISAAIPSFVAAIVLILIFSVKLGWFPTIGTGSGFAGTAYHLTLPAFALALSSLAIVARVTRSSVRDELGREHVQTAVSRGIPYPQLVRRHVLRNAAIPITTISGITIASLIALAAVVERAFSLNGLGAYLVAASSSKDFAVVQGISLILVTAFVVVNVLVDILYAVLDPRVSLGSRAT